MTAVEQSQPFIDEFLREAREVAERNAIKATAIMRSANHFADHWSAFNRAIDRCEADAIFQTATQTCLKSRSWWFAILNIAQRWRELLTEEIFTAMIKALERGRKAAEHADPGEPFGEYPTEEQKNILGKVQDSLIRRIASVKELASRADDPCYSTAQFVEVGAGAH